MPLPHAFLVWFNNKSLEENVLPKAQGAVALDAEDDSHILFFLLDLIRFWCFDTAARHVVSRIMRHGVGGDFQEDETATEVLA